MGKVKHSEGIWSVGRKVGSAVYAGDMPVAFCDSMSESPSGTDAANARRIVACVNACEGIATGDLVALGDTGILAKANQNADVVKGQRDLLNALIERFLGYNESEHDGVSLVDNDQLFKDCADAIESIKVGK